MSQLDFFNAGDPPPDRSRLRPRKGLYLGTSGWSYKDWVGVFYPKGLAQSEWLSSFSEVFDTVEIDSTFYGPPRKETVQGWRQKTRPGFLFAAKFPKVITHEKLLVGAELETAVFVETMAELGEKLGPLLLQLPATFRASAETKQALFSFVESLPKGPRYSVELRHDGWFTPEVFSVLEANGVSLAHCDWPGVTTPEKQTAPFVYARLIGDRDLTVFNKPVYDREAELSSWARRVDSLLEGGATVFLYINNHYEGHSPHTLRGLREKLRE